MTAAPSVIGAMSCLRNGSAKYGVSSSSADVPLVVPRAAPRTSARSFSDQSPASRPSRAWIPAIETESGHRGVTTYGSSCRASTRRSCPALDLPKP